MNKILINKNGERSSKDSQIEECCYIPMNIYMQNEILNTTLNKLKPLNFVPFCTQDVFHPDFYIFKFYVLLPPTYLHLYNQHLKRYNNPSKSD